MHGGLSDASEAVEELAKRTSGYRFELSLFALEPAAARVSSVYIATVGLARAH